MMSTGRRGPAAGDPGDATGIELDIIAPLAATVALVASGVIVSMKKYFWNDELYSHYLLADPSFGGMLAAFHDAINNSPPLYFVLGWIWARVFGADELALRLFSTLGMCVALWLLWLTLRRAYGLWPATLGTFAVFCTSELILAQNAEARMYGLFLALCAGAVLLHDRAARADSLRTGAAILLFCVHAGIVLTHLLGPLFSAAFLVALIAADRRNGRFRPRAYLPIIAAWLTFLLYLPSFLVQMQAGRPRSWLPAPTPGDLLGFMTLSEGGLLRPAALGLVLVTAAVYPLLRRMARRAGTTPDPEEPRAADDGTPQDASHLLILALVLIAVPLVAWVVSATVRPIFQDRYVIPATLGWAILLSHIVALSMRGGPRFAVLPAAASLLLLVQPLRYALHHPTETRPGVADEVFGHADLPIVVQSSHRFVERLQYATDAARYFFILDWEAAVADASGPFGPQEHRHLEALLRNYPERFAGRVVESDAFLASHDRFLVLDALEFDRACPPHVEGLSRWDDIHCPQWLERRILRDPRWSARVVGRMNDWTMILVALNPAGGSRPPATPGSSDPR